MKKFVVALGITLSVFFSSFVYAEKNAVIYVDGSCIDTEAFISEDNNCIYVPVRSVFEAMGCDVQWNMENKMAEITYNGITAKLQLYQDYIFDIKIISDRIYLPLKDFSELFGLDAQWNEEDRTININGTISHHENSGGFSEKYEIKDTSNFAEKINQYMPDNKNYVFSPICLKYAFAMAANGADEETKIEIMKAFNIDDLDKYNDNVKEYLSKITLKKDNIDADSRVNLNIANSIWLNEDYIKDGGFNDNFKKLVNNKYNASAKVVNNKNAVQNINAWCADNTNNKITQIVSDNDFLSCLVNAVYFKGMWSSGFYNKEKAVFTDRNSKKSEIDFMNQTEHFKYYADNNIKIISMPYYDSKNDVSMYLAIVDDKSIDFEKYIEKMSEKKVKVSLPKFKTEYSVNSDNALSIFKNLGIKRAFESNQTAYHFKNMFNDAVNDETSVYLSDVIHKAFIDVNETGTEAAAVSALTQCGSLDVSVPEKIYDFTANTPFTYFIRDNGNGEILFIGEYAFVE